MEPEEARRLDNGAMDLKPHHSQTCIRVWWPPRLLEQSYWCKGGCTSGVGPCNHGECLSLGLSLACIDCASVLSSGGVEVQVHLACTCIMHNDACRTLCVLCVLVAAVL